MICVGFTPRAGGGYAATAQAAPEGLKKEKGVDRAQSITRHTGRKLDRAIIVVLLLALLVAEMKLAL